MLARWGVDDQCIISSTIVSNLVPQCLCLSSSKKSTSKSLMQKAEKKRSLEGKIKGLAAIRTRGLSQFTQGIP